MVLIDSLARAEIFDTGKIMLKWTYQVGRLGGYDDQTVIVFRSPFFRSVHIAEENEQKERRAFVGGK